MIDPLDAENNQSADGPASPLPALYIKTFGCQMNEYDSERVQHLLATSHRRVQTPEEADLIFVNTCSVREKGEHKLFSMLGSLRELKKEKPELVIGVGGCVAQQEGSAIVKRNPSVDFVVGTHNLSLVPSLLRAVNEGRGTQVAVDYREEWEDLPEIQAEDANLGRVRALIAIQRGCDKRCAFCVVPTTRGPEISRDPAEILREARLKVRAGAKEVMLLGQTVNSFGKDLTPRYPFERLIRELAEIEGLLRIRFISPHPAEVRPAFIELYGEVPKLSPHLHMPLQSGSDRILKLMNRNYRMSRYYEIVDRVRDRAKDVAVTTDIITGFPTETEEDFEATLEALRRVQYSTCYAYQYSRRPNTTAITNFTGEDEVPFEVGRERLAKLLSVQKEISRSHNLARIGTTVEVLVEDRAPGLSSGLGGRIPQNTPIEILPGDAQEGEIRPGDLIRAKVEHCTPNGLRGVFCGKV